ncbi:MAG: ATP-binding protein [Aquabacterium sp.]
MANAIKFTEHGEVVVDIRRAIGGVVSGIINTEVSGATQPIGLSSWCATRAVGMPADVVPRLFSAFMQANGGMARRYGGTGLGLAISEQLVELIGGQHRGGTARPAWARSSSSRAGARGRHPIEHGHARRAGHALLPACWSWTTTTPTAR